MTLYEVTSSRAYLLVSAGDGPTLIVNRDQSIQLFLGRDAAVSTAQQTNLSIVDPLGSRTVSGNVDVWAVAASGQVLVDVQVDALSWQASPAQIAAQISAAGIFSLSKSTLLATFAAATVGSGTNTPIGVPALNSFTQIGYEIQLLLGWLNPPTDDLRCAITMQWLDSNTSQIVDVQKWYTGAAASGAPLQVIGTGPTKGDQLTVIVDNEGSQSVVVQGSLLVNSRTYLKDNWYWNTVPTFQNYTAGLTSVQQLSTNVLMAREDNIAANTTNSYAVGLAPGRCSFRWRERNLVNQGNMSFQLLTSGNVNSVIQDLFLEPEGEFEFIAGRYPIVLKVHNKTANTSDTALRIVTLDG